MFANKLNYSQILFEGQESYQNNEIIDSLLWLIQFIIINSPKELGGIEMKKITGIYALFLLVMLLSYCSGPMISEQSTGSEATDAVLGDTSHISVYFQDTDQVIAILCIEGDTINIPCKYEDDGILTIICQDQLFAACGDTSHVPHP